MSDKIIRVSAPARICLFGDHQDYLGLPIIACAIDRYINLIAKPVNSKTLHIIMPDIDDERNIAIDKPFVLLSERDYFISALNVLSRYGCAPNCGYELTISGNIPVNAGLSSSSAVLVVWITFLLEAFGCNEKVTSELIAKLAYTAEVLEFNAPGGLMDQYSISLGDTVFLDTVTGNHTYINNEVKSLIIGESGVPKETLGVLSQLGNFAKKSIKQVKEFNPLFEISNTEISDYEKYKEFVDNELRPIFYAAIKNYSITKDAFTLLQSDNPDIAEIGKLMDEHHLELRDHLGITVPIIDSMIEGAKNAGAQGAKIVGSGGGGCIVAICESENEEKVIQGVLNGGASAAYKINIGKGVRVL